MFITRASHLRYYSLFNRGLTRLIKNYMNFRAVFLSANINKWRRGLLVFREKREVLDGLKFSVLPPQQLGSPPLLAVPSGTLLLFQLL